MRWKKCTVQAMHIFYDRRTSCWHNILDIDWADLEGRLVIQKNRTRPVAGIQVLSVGADKEGT
jgi:hypothetical protein